MKPQDFNGEKKTKTESKPQCLYIHLKSIKMSLWGKKKGGGGGGLNTIENKLGF